MLTAVSGRLFLIVLATGVFVGGCNRAARTSGNVETEPAAEKITDLHPDSKQVRIARHAYRGPAGEEVLHGFFQEFYASGALRSEGSFSHGKHTGHWVARHENGKVWVEGDFQNGAPVGEWVYFDEAGMEIGRRLNGVKFGPWRERNAHGDSYAEGEYVDDRMEGLWRFETVDGEPLCEITFQRGTPHGKARIHSMVTTEYTLVRDAGVPDFTNPFWLPEEAPFDPPRTHTQRTYWPDGRLRTEIEFRVGIWGGQPMRVRHGRSSCWFKNGALEAEHLFQNGLEQGQSRSWHSNGRPRYEVAYEHGRPSGKWTFWTETGRKVAEGEFRPDGASDRWSFWNTKGEAITVNDIEGWLRTHFRLEGDHSLPARGSGTG